MTPTARKAPPPSATRVQDWFNTNWPILTKVIIFVLGVSILVNEYFLQPKPDSTAVGGALALIGVVPFTFKNGKT